MIQPNELRVGNYVMFTPDFDLGHAQIIGILEEDAKVKYDDGKIDYPLLDWLKPIPITREWVEKLGFEISTWHERVEVWSHPDHIPGLVCIDGEKWLHSHDDDLDSVELKSVHQLQNLFFALTGTELTIK